MDDSSRDRERMRSVARSLAQIETDEPATSDQLAVAIAAANEFRSEHGIPALRDDDDPPEEEFYRRARALGFRHNFS